MSNEDEFKWIKFDALVTQDNESGGISFTIPAGTPVTITEKTSNPLSILDNEDWAEAFDERDRSLSQEIEAYDVSDAQFTRSDVAKIFAAVIEYGCHNEADCYGLFQLKDGRYLSVEAWCDTTGWDCQAGTVKTVASSLGTLIEMGVTSAGRRAYLNSMLDDIKTMESGDELIGLLMSDGGWRYEILKPREYKEQEKY